MGVGGPHRLNSTWSVFVGVLLGAAVQYVIASWQRPKLSAEALATDTKTAADLFEDLQAARSRELELTAERDRLQEDVAALSSRLSHLEAIMPAVLLASRMETMAEDLGVVLDTLHPGVVLSSPQNDGQFLWVNEAFCLALGRSREEILALGWRELIHPSDLHATNVAEAGAWSGPVRVVNRYRHADGHWVTLRWVALRYQGGVTISSARVEEPE